jgi:hypothetical protein
MLVNEYSKFISVDVDKVSDYFIDWIDQGKYNIKIIKTPAKYKAGYSSRITGYGNSIISRKASYNIRFEVVNNVKQILTFFDELNKIVDRWSLKGKMHSSSVSGNKIKFSLEI